MLKLQHLCFEVDGKKIVNDIKMCIRDNIHRDTITHGMIETVKGDKTTIKSVVTGDTTMLGFYVALFAFSGLMILVYAKHCKNQN